MKFFIFHLLFILILVPGQAQNMVGIYKTEFKVKSSIDMSKYQAANVPKTREDSILSMFITEMVHKAESTVMTIPTLDSVLVYQDSSVVINIPMSDTTINKDQRVVVHTKNNILNEGESYSMGKDGKKENSERGMLEFKPLNKKEKISGYDCEIWLSTDSTMKIWISRKLPFLLSPGFQIPKSLGGVLRLELKEPGNEIDSEIKEIKFL